MFSTVSGQPDPAKLSNLVTGDRFGAGLENLGHGEQAKVF
jgi:hypothetical protein